MRLTALLTLLSGLFTQVSLAKELQGRLGLGYNAQFENIRVAGGVPAISAKYFFNRRLGAELAFGTTTGSDKNGVSALKVFNHIFFETNLNFYGMLGGGIVTIHGTSGAQFIAGLGAEFYIPGIESLGFSMETGATLENVTQDTFILKTMGISFLNAGMHFYF